MINSAAIFLVVASLVAAGVWSPARYKEVVGGEDVITKEGHRVVVVEFEKEGKGSTKVLISPTRSRFSELSGDTTAEETKERTEHSSSPAATTGEHGFRPRDLVCDALGKCNHKIARVMGKTREIVAERISEAGEVFGRTKDAVTEKAQEVSGKAGEAVDNAKQGAMDKSRLFKEELQKNLTAGKAAITGKVEEAFRLKEEGEKNLSDIIRRGEAVARDVVAYCIHSWAEATKRCAAVVHLLGFATAFGACMWITFFSSYLLAQTLPRQQFGILQSKIYPVYFRVVSSGIGVTVLTHWLLQRKNSSITMSDSVQGIVLLTSLTMVLINGFFLEPRATKAMFQRLKMEKEEGRGGDERAEKTEKERSKSQLVILGKKLKKMNAASSVLNILTIMSLSFHLVYLAFKQRI